MDTGSILGRYYKFHFTNSVPSEQSQTAVAPKASQPGEALAASIIEEGNVSDPAKINWQLPTRRKDHVQNCLYQAAIKHASPQLKSMKDRLVQDRVGYLMTQVPLTNIGFRTRVGKTEKQCIDNAKQCWFPEAEPFIQAWKSEAGAEAYRQTQVTAETEWNQQVTKCVSRLDNTQLAGQPSTVAPQANERSRALMLRQQTPQLQNKKPSVDDKGVHQGELLLSNVPAGTHAFANISTGILHPSDQSTAQGSGSALYPASLPSLEASEKPKRIRKGKQVATREDIIAEMYDNQQHVRKVRKVRGLHEICARLRKEKNMVVDQHKVQQVLKEEVGIRRFRKPVTDAHLYSLAHDGSRVRTPSEIRGDLAKLKLGASTKAITTQRKIAREKLAADGAGLPNSGDISNQ